MLATIFYPISMIEKTMAPDGIAAYSVPLNMGYGPAPVRPDSAPPWASLPYRRRLSILHPYLESSGLELAWKQLILAITAAMATLYTFVASALILREHDHGKMAKTIAAKPD
ncbi:MAG: hypothetical protein GX806_00620 [Lentisphaerae bacterium]|nr:hypothetical protein [Lentisphaerota bacterium]